MGLTHVLHHAYLGVSSAPDFLSGLDPSMRAAQDAPSTSSSPAHDGIAATITRLMPHASAVLTHSNSLVMPEPSSLATQLQPEASHGTDHSTATDAAASTSASAEPTQPRDSSNPHPTLQRLAAQVQRMVHDAMLAQQQARAAGLQQEAFGSGGSSRGGPSLQQQHLPGWHKGEEGVERQLAAMLRALAASLEAPDATPSLAPSAADSSNAHQPQPRDPNAPAALVCPQPTLLDLVRGFWHPNDGANDAEEAGAAAASSQPPPVPEALLLSLLLPGLLWMFNVLRVLAALPRRSSSKARDATQSPTTREQGTDLPELESQQQQQQAAGLVLVQYQTQMLQLEAQHRAELASVHDKYTRQLRALQQQQQGRHSGSRSPLPRGTSDSEDVAQGSDQCARSTADGDTYAGMGAGAGLEFQFAATPPPSVGAGAESDVRSSAADGGGFGSPCVAGFKQMQGRASPGSRLCGGGGGVGGSPGGRVSVSPSSPQVGGLVGQLMEATALASGLRRQAERQARAWRQMQPQQQPQQHEGDGGGGYGTPGRVAKAIAMDDVLLSPISSIRTASAAQTPCGVPQSPLSAGMHRAHSPAAAAAAAVAAASPVSPSATRAALHQLQERLSSAHRKRMEEMEDEHTQTLDALTESHRSQQARLTAQLAEQQGEAQALRRQLAALQRAMDPDPDLSSGGADTGAFLM